MLQGLQQNHPSKGLKICNAFTSACVTCIGCSHGTYPLKFCLSLLQALKYDPLLMCPFKLETHHSRAMHGGGPLCDRGFPREKQPAFHALGQGVIVISPV